MATTAAKDKDATPAEQQQAAETADKPAPKQQVRSATPAGEDGTARTLHVTGLLDEFGPITIGDGDDKRSYTLTRAGTVVEGPDVAAVRAIAQANHVPLRSTKAPEAAK